jgi:hypothetical protein
MLHCALPQCVCVSSSIPCLPLLCYNVLSCKMLGCVCLCHTAVCLKKQHVKDNQASWQKHNKTPSLHYRLIRVESSAFFDICTREPFFVFFSKSAIFRAHSKSVAFLPHNMCLGHVFVTLCAWEHFFSTSVGTSRARIRKTQLLRRDHTREPPADRAMYAKRSAV